MFSAIVVSVVYAAVPIIAIGIGYAVMKKDYAGLEAEPSAAAERGEES